MKKRSELKAENAILKKQNDTLRAAMEERVNAFRIDTHFLGFYWVVTRVEHGGEMALVSRTMFPDKKPI